MRALLLVMLAACGRDKFDPAHNIAFVTSTLHDPLTFGTDGAGADALCTQTAHNASLAGEYHAYIATVSVAAIDHLGNARGWIRTDGKPFVDTVGDLLAGHHFYALRLDENGDDIGPNAVSVATGADTTGRAYFGGNCTDWTDPAAAYEIGLPSASGMAWSTGGANPCTNGAHLYCFGVGYTTPLEMTPVAGRLAFVTVQAYVPTGGLAGADALCASEASAAGLPGSFLALLPTSSTSAISRFDISGPTWVRPDGIALADSPLAFASGDLLASPNLTALGSPTANRHVMTGGAIPLPMIDPCNDWTGGPGGSQEGNCNFASIQAFDSTTTGCNGEPIYCLAQ